MNILITGVHSIAGAFLVEKLSPYHTVYGMDDVSEPMEGLKRVYRCTDIPKTLEVDAVIHLAGKDADTIDLSKSLEYMENNVGLTRCIFEWFKTSSAKQFYYLSSIKVLGNSPNVDNMTEDLDPKPFGPLGESKLLVEQYLMEKWLFDKKVYVLRTSYLHGRGLFFNDNSKILYRWIEKGLPYVFGSFECKRSFTSLDNLQYVIEQMLKKNVPGGVYHLTDDGFMTSSDIYRMVGRVLGKKARIWRLGRFIFKPFAVVSGWFNGYFDTFEYNKLTRNFVSNNSKLKRSLGIDSMPFPLEEGLIKSIKEYDESLRKERELNC